MKNIKKGNFWDNWTAAKSLLIMVPIFGVILFLTMGAVNTFCSIDYSPEWLCWNSPTWVSITVPIGLFVLYGLAIWRMLTKD